MRRTVLAALRHGVAIGAHPGLPDRDNFGRVHRTLAPDDAYEMVVYQVAALDGFVRAAGRDGALAHVKPHGALYTMAASDPVLAGAIAQAVSDVNPRLVLMGLSGGALIRAGLKAGLATASEVVCRSQLPIRWLAHAARPSGGAPGGRHARHRAGDQAGPRPAGPVTAATSKCSARVQPCRPRAGGGSPAKSRPKVRCCTSACVSLTWMLPMPARSRPGRSHGLRHELRSLVANRQPRCTSRSSLVPTARSSSS